MKWPKTGIMRVGFGLSKGVAIAFMLLGCFITASGQTAARRRAAALLPNPVSAQIDLPGPDMEIPEPTILIREKTFHGQISATFPMAFMDCIFVGDGNAVLKSTDGAIFLNCCFRTDGTGVLNMTESGDNIVMVDCYLIGYDGFNWSQDIRKTDRNYVSGLTLNGREISLESDANTIEMDGLDMVDMFREVSHGDTIYRIPAPANFPRLTASGYRVSLKGDSVKLMVEGGADDMFVGWWTDYDYIRLVPGPEPSACTVILDSNVGAQREVVVNVVTDSGLELAIALMAGERVKSNDIVKVLSARQMRRNKRAEKRLAGK